MQLRLSVTVNVCAHIEVRARPEVFVVGVAVIPAAAEKEKHYMKVHWCMFVCDCVSVKLTVPMCGLFIGPAAETAGVRAVDVRRL